MVNASEDKHVKRSNHMENINSEKYSRGRRGAPAKGVGRETGARVQIPLSPLSVISKSFQIEGGFVRFMVFCISG